jgi:hemerythrin-like domain-containing protein
MAAEVSTRQNADMGSDTRRLLEELREDHRNMALVLNILDTIAGSAKAGKDPDFELVDEIMRYMTVYPDAVHHPKEDVVYSELKKSRPDLAIDLDDVPADHREIAVLGSNLRDDVEAIIAGAAVRRENFVKDTTEYVQHLRDHMQWEEEDLFKRVDEMIADEGQSIDVAKYQHIKDPVFELEIESVFGRLTASLKSDGKLT